MKLEAQLAGQTYQLTMLVRERQITAEIDGRRYLLELRREGRQNLLLIEGSSVYEVLVDPSREHPNSYDVQLQSHDFEIRLVDPKRLRSGQSFGAHDHGEARVVAPMPGKVVRILVERGTQVEAGGGIVIVEAMKMQNELKSPKTGVVTAINCAAGSTVEAGEVLAVVE